MNLEKSSRLLEKINRLYQNIELDENISSIERDLMMNYVREFYESFLPEGKESDLDQTAASTPVKPVAPVQQQTPPPPTPEPPAVEDKSESIESSQPEIPRERDRDMDELKRRIEENARKAQEKLQQKSGSFQPAEQKVTPPPPVPKQEPEPIKNSAQEKSPENGTSTHTEEMDEVEQLFEFKEARELSEKLSEMPISDLSNAMGLNEKIFTINELFGGNKNLYDEAINELNSFNAFEQAKEYLIDNIARRFDWTNNEKRKKAKIFIKLVRRRYK